MTIKSKLGTLVLVLVFVCAVVLSGCDLGAEYTLINNSNFEVNGNIGDTSFSVEGGKTAYVSKIIGGTTLDTITYSPADKVKCTISEGGFTATFTNK
jgi:hypothetical protein